MLAVACRSRSLLHDSVMDSTTEAEDLGIDPQLLAQLENLESQCNPDFHLGLMSGYLASFCSKNCSIVQKLCD